MSLLSNSNPVRLSIYQTWFSNWYENNPVYSSLIYSDLYINEFLNGIYYKLKLPSCLPMIRDLGYKQTMIFIKSLVLKKNKYNRLNKLNIYMRILKVKHRKYLFFFKRSMKQCTKFFFFHKKMVNENNENNFFNFLIFLRPSYYILENIRKLKKLIYFKNIRYKLFKKNKKKIKKLNFKKKKITNFFFYLKKKFLN